ncbi:RHS repeat-associated core domain-containing protein [Paraburkholderia elongata]|nr:RHS repeat-associated core domain-containing protein [Paraburkholderia elongata]
MYYYRNRYYSPATGRFISEDPIGYASEQTNAYAYVDGNPVQFSDPSGLQAFGFPVPVGPMPGGGPIYSKPATGDPDSTYWPGLRPDGTYGDGRKYGPDARPAIDYDHGHPGITTELAIMCMTGLMAYGANSPALMVRCRNRPNLSPQKMDGVRQSLSDIHKIGGSRCCQISFR